MDANALGELLQHLFVPEISWVEKIIRPIIVYAALVGLLRLGGRRELAQMNSFDLVILLIISNAVQNAIIGEDNSLVGGLVGGATLILLNLGVNRFLYSHPQLDEKLEGEPITLVKDGRILRKHLQHELITESELLAAVRRQGLSGVEAVEEVILETSGMISVVPKSPSPREHAMEDIIGRLDRIEQLVSSPPAR
jgi:uncharacterized membrane protein YcaP (DUF421 family)